MFDYRWHDIGRGSYLRSFLAALFTFFFATSAAHAGGASARSEPVT
jgi:hypothetical protein